MMIEPLYLGTNGHVAALDPRTGERIWRTKLRNGGWGQFVSLSLDDTRVYAGHYGLCHALDRFNGTPLWTNDLPRMGYTMVLLAGGSGGGESAGRCAHCGEGCRLAARYCGRCGAAIPREATRQQAAPLFLTTNGHLAALDRGTGAELWRMTLPKGHWGGLVSLVLSDTRLYAGCFGRAYAIDRVTGATLWINDLPGLGYHSVNLIMRGASSTSSGELGVGTAIAAAHAAAAAS